MFCLTLPRTKKCSSGRHTGNTSDAVSKPKGGKLEKRSKRQQVIEGPNQYTVTTGVPQSSVLNSFLGNVIYNSVLVVSVPMEVTIIGFAVDLTVVIAKQPEN